MKNKIFESAKEKEINFFDEAASLRDSKDKIISQEVDIRRATKYIPNNGEKFHVIDPHMENIKSGIARNRYIDLVAHKPGGRVLDLGCGSGWLSLELARKGQIVDAYDISSKSISLAKKTLKANPYKEGFGKINYYNKDFSNIDFGENKYDAIRLDTYSQNPRNQRFYTKRGYADLGPVYLKYKKDHPYYCYELLLNTKG